MQGWFDNLKKEGPLRADVNEYLEDVTSYFIKPQM